MMKGFYSAMYTLSHERAGDWRYFWGAMLSGSGIRRAWANYCRRKRGEI